MRPVREASDGSRTSSPPSPKTIHSGTLSQTDAGPAGYPLARSHSSLAMLAWLDHGRPVVRSNAAANSGASWPAPSISRSPRPSNKASTETPGRAEQHADLAHAGHAEPAYADRSPRRFSLADRSPDQFDGQVEEAVRIDLRLAPATGMPRGGLLYVRGNALRHGDTRPRRNTGPRGDTGWATALAEVVPMSMPMTISAANLMGVAPRSRVR